MVHGVEVPALIGAGAAARVLVLVSGPAASDRDWGHFVFPSGVPQLKKPVLIPIEITPKGSDQAICKIEFLDCENLYRMVWFLGIFALTK